MAAAAPQASGVDLARYPDPGAMAAALQPAEPVYCLYPHVLRSVARRFLEGFPGRTLYAVKANPDPRVLRALVAAGVRHFDSASLPEIELASGLCPEGTCYFMAPVKLEGAARAAYERHGVHHFVVDHADELDRMLDEIGGDATSRALVVFVRVATHSEHSTYDLSTKFGAPPAEAPALIERVAARGCEPALAFNVGSLVRRPGAYLEGLETCAGILRAAPAPIRLLDVGGGFPSAYPGYEVAPLEDFFEAIGRVRRELPLAPDAELLGEPGRALVAESVSLLTRVLLRKPDAVYVNDGMWGSLIEPFLSRGRVTFPVRCWRGGAPLEEEPRRLRVFGPTCDSLDVLPQPFPLPTSICAGDFVEFGTLGAYSLANRTRFNGFYPDAMVAIDAPCLPPGAG